MKEINLIDSDYTLFTGIKNGKIWRKKLGLNQFKTLKINNRKDQVITASFLNGLISEEIIYFHKEGLSKKEIIQKITFSNENDLLNSELVRMIVRLLQ